MSIQSLLWPGMGQDGAVVASVGSDWVFGLGAGKSSYWKLGTDELIGPSADREWHIFSGTLQTNGDATLEEMAMM